MSNRLANLFYFLIDKIILVPLEFILNERNTILLVRHGESVGDHVMLTALIEYFGKVEKRSVIVISKYADLFLNNPHVLRVYPSPKNKLLKKVFFAILSCTRRPSIIYFTYKNIGNYDFENYMRLTSNESHLRNVYLWRTYWVMPAELNNKIYFTKEEKALLKQRLRLPKIFCVIQSQGKVSYTKRKCWGIKNMQEVVNLTAHNIRWVQCGAIDDPLLNLVIDMRMYDRRADAYILSNASLVLCNEGYFTHLSNAVDTKCLTIQSGFLPEGCSAYSNVTRIASKKYFRCSPCWNHGICKFINLVPECMADITSKIVVDEVKKILNA